MAFTVKTRGRVEPRAAAVEHVGEGPMEALLAALQSAAHPPESEPVVEWDGASGLAAAEIDWHDAEPPEFTLLAIAQLQPAPRLLWRSHGGGVKAVHVRDGPYDAEELAALWCFEFLGTEHAHGSTGAEVAVRFRHPAYPRGAQMCSAVEQVDGTDAAGAMRRLFGGPCEQDDALRDAWLEENGFELHRAYPHDRCPIEPEHVSHSAAPVWMGDGAVMCHSCEGRGTCYGNCKRPGVVPYAMLCGLDRGTNLLRLMARGWCHWEHAQHVLKHLGAPKQLARLVYTAALKAAQPLQLPSELAQASEAERGAWLLERVEQLRLKRNRVFACRVPLVRVEGGLWVNSDDLTSAADKGLKHLLNCLPATHRHNSKGVSVRMDRKMGMFLEGIDLTSEGYPPLHVLLGVDMNIGCQWRDDAVVIVKEASPAFRFREQRDPLEARRRIEAEFPGISWDYLTLCLYAKAFSQRGGTEPPMVYVWGQSGAGKTTTWQLGSVIALSPAVLVDLDRNNERFLQSLADACLSSDYIVIDEVDKYEMSSRQLAKIILGIRYGRGYHRMYIGSRHIHKTPSILLADTGVAPVFEELTQLRRRTIGLELGAGRVSCPDWRTTCSTGNVMLWRRGAGNAELGDEILSEAIVKAQQFATFEQAAQSLGYDILQQADDNAPLLALFQLVCGLSASPVQEQHFSGKGWMVFDLNVQEGSASSNGEVAETPTMRFKRLWRRVDAAGNGQQRIREAAWSNIVSASGIIGDCKMYGQRVGVRFRDGEPRRDATRYNAQLLL